MKGSLEKLLENLKSLKLYMEFQNQSFKVSRKYFKDNSNEDFKELQIASIKKFNYNCYIITLYGLFERFIENLLIKYLEELSSIAPTYNGLPDPIKENNVTKSIDILSSLSLGKNKHQKPETIIEILNNNLNKNISKLNYEAFAQHKANFRLKSIDDFFKNVGLNNISTIIRQYSPLKEKLDSEYSDIHSKKASIIFNQIDDLAERRNDIAHGVENIQILNSSILENYIDFVYCFCETIYSVVSEKIIEYLFLNRSIEIIPIFIFKHTILCCELNKISLNKKTKILVYRSSDYPKYIMTEINEIQVNKVTVDQIDGLGRVKVGLSLKHKITNSNSFAILN